MFGGGDVNMRGAQIYIKNIEKQKFVHEFGGRGVSSFNWGSLPSLGVV